MNKPESVPPPSRQPARPRAWKRVFFWCGSVLLLLLGGGLLVYFKARQTADNELEKAIAEVDRQDPGWRLEELEAKRKVIPPNQNGALHVLAAGKRIPENWP